MTNYRMAKLYQLISFLVYLIPLAVLVGINHESYFKTPGYSMSMMGYVLVIFALIGFKSKFKEFATKNTVLTFSLVIFVICLVMRYLADQLLLISLVSLIGAVASSIFNPVIDAYWAKGHTNGEKNSSRAIPQKLAWRIAYGFPVDSNNEEKTN